MGRIAKIGESGPVEDGYLPFLEKKDNRDMRFNKIKADYRNDLITTVVVLSVESLSLDCSLEISTDDDWNQYGLDHFN